MAADSKYSSGISLGAWATSPRVTLGVRESRVHVEEDHSFGRSARAAGVRMRWPAGARSARWDGRGTGRLAVTAGELVALAAFRMLLATVVEREITDRWPAF